MKHLSFSAVRQSWVGLLAPFICVGFLTLATGPARANNVALVQSTKYFAPETLTLLQSRAASGASGLQAGDIITYIIQSTQLANGATTGVAGYITDYIPPDTEVVGADIVAPDSSGNFQTVAPNLPGGIATGWGLAGQNTFTAPFDNASAYDTTGRCLQRGYSTNNCNAKLTELYADTGIFYSTDPRTAAFPASPNRMAQGGNGYDINPAQAASLNAILGQSAATTHNQWDADQTNAFGSTAAAIAALASPNSSAQALMSGAGPTPFLAGSPVAGPQTGYPLDNTGQIGPWKRIAYAGSRMGDSSAGPANTAGASSTAIGGFSTPLGYAVSEANPLPGGTMAVRWAIGKLTAGQLSYVRIKLRVTRALQASGIVNSAEVFAGDAGGADTGKDNAWSTHVPSVADNQSNLYVSKVACAYDPAAATCVPLISSAVAGSPTTPTITYRISYFNTGNATQSNVVLSDILPCQSANASTVKVGDASGPLASLISIPYTTLTTSAGNCATTPPSRATVTFPTIASMGPMAGGQMIINVPSSASTEGDKVINSARLTSNEIPAGSTSNAVASVGNSGSPVLVISMSVRPSTYLLTSVGPYTTQYVITVTNAGSGPAYGLQINDLLPGNTSGSSAYNYRFNLFSLDSVASTGLTTLTALVTSTSTVATSGLTPYSTQPGAGIQINLSVNFGTTSFLASNGVVTLTFTAEMGPSIVATTYYNNVVARATAGSTYRIDSGPSAPVAINGTSSLQTALVCYYDSGNNCVAPQLNAVPANARLRYRVAYSTTGMPGPTLTDTLPCQVSTLTGSPTVTVTAVAGPLGSTGTLAVSSGNCPSVRRSVVLASAGTLPANSFGTITFEVQLSTPTTTPTTSTTVTNDAVFNSSVNPPPPQSSGVTVLVNAQSVLQVSKTVSSPAALPGSTVSYTITVTNIGTVPAQSINLFDVMPTGTATSADPTRRFTYQPGSSVVSGALTSVAPTTQLTPNLTGFTGSAYAANQQQLNWNFAGQSLGVGATATVQITAAIGANLVPLPPPNYYYNYAVASASNATSVTSNPTASNVTLIANLSVTKSNGVSTVTAGDTTAYTVTVSNLGPSAADNAVIKDVPGTGLNCTSVTCAATNGSAQCPTALPINTAKAPAATSFFSIGEAIPSLPANSSVTFRVSCSVTASGL